MQFVIIIYYEVIKMRDLLYFVLRQVFNNYSYEKMNSIMKCEKKQM